MHLIEFINNMQETGITCSHELMVLHKINKRYARMSSKSFRIIELPIFSKVIEISLGWDEFFRKNQYTVSKLVFRATSFYGFPRKGREEQ